MASVFFERSSLDVLKENMSHTEACGITTVRVGPKAGRWMHEAHSYWDGEADRDDFGRRLVPFTLLTRKPVSAGPEECAINPRSRSARLRAAQKIDAHHG
jgi:hypothetical protein